MNIKSMAIRFNPKPALAICGIVSWPLASTLALGPVPEGSMKAQEAAIVAGTIKRKGWKFPASETPAKTGKNTAVVAVLELISVKNTIAATTAITIKDIGISFNIKFFPIHATNPEDLNAEAIANPPPISIPIAQGISWASFHSNNLSTSHSLFLRPLERLNKAIAAKNAKENLLQIRLHPKR